MPIQTHPVIAPSWLTRSSLEVAPDLLGYQLWSDRLHPNHAYWLNPGNRSTLAMVYQELPSRV